MDRIPILKIGDVLLVSIQVDMHDQLAMALQDDLTMRITQDNARGVLIDISTLAIVDAYGRLIPSASNAELIVLAVNMPPHAPSPGQALRSMARSSSGSIEPAATAPTASNTLVMSMARPSW